MSAEPLPIGRAALRGWTAVLRAGIGVLALGAVLTVAGGALGTGAALTVPLECFAIVAALLLAPPGAAGWLRRLVVVLCGLMLFVALADLGTQAAFSRPFNPLLDVHLFVSGWHLLSGTIGLGSALAYVAASLAAFFAALLLLAWGLAGLARLGFRTRRRLGLLAVLLVGAGAAFNAVGHGSWAGFAAAENARQRAALLVTGWRDLAAFERQLAQAPGPTTPERLLAGLEGKDVLFVFIESYGRSAIADERYARTIGARLADFERRIGASGFSARSGWLTSPTVGGQSWLAHATLLSGLWVDSQPRYERLMTSRRDSLNALFGQAGWRTVAVMPAITMEWPEAAWYGYDAVYAKNHLGYRGKPFDWVTMPDQYTLSALKRLELEAPGRPPVMAEIALISSHAPWTPIPPLLEWEAIGDGTAFNIHASAGDPPEVVWRDPERVREQYLLAVDYSLETLASFVETQVGGNAVLVILGDHQPAPIVTGEGASRDVPVHVISADPAVLEAIEAWRFEPGMRPGEATPVWRMDAFRARFVEAYSR